MKTMIRFIIICFVIFPNEINGMRRRCTNTGVFFTDKILRSPIIVYGESLAKRIYVETDTELLFNITFRVDCIFKGQNIENEIEITEAGIKIGRSACQWLDPGKLYVVFLENCGSNMSIYCPLDFQERMVDDMTYELLQKTCRLTRIPPLHSISDKCPNVSITEFCPSEIFLEILHTLRVLLDDDIDIKIMPKGKNSGDVNTNMKISFNNANHFYPQSNVTMPNDRSLVGQILDNPNNHASLLSLASVWMIMLAISTAMFI